MSSSISPSRLILLTGLLSGLALTGLARADVIVLRNQIVEGKIVSETEKMVEITTSAGRSQKIRLSKVIEVVRDVDAEGYFRGAIGKLAEDDAEGRARLGFLAARSKQADLSREFYLAALAIDPGNATAGRGLGYALVDGEWVEPQARDTSAPGSGAADSGKPTVYLDVHETIDELPWQDFLRRFPNPKYTESVGSQLGGTLFFRGHEWRLVSEADAGKADFVARLRLTAKQTRSTDWMTQRMQVFYEATISLELVRNSDEARVLWVKSVNERGHHDEGSAARNAFLRAADSIVKDEQIVESPLWADPAGTPAAKKQLVVSKPASKKE